jgi:hypothetical protein
MAVKAETRCPASWTQGSGGILSTNPWTTELSTETGRSHLDKQNSGKKSGPGTEFIEQVGPCLPVKNNIKACSDCRTLLFLDAFRREAALRNSFQVSPCRACEHGSVCDAWE